MIAWAIETVVATTLLMALVLVIRAPVRRWVGPQIAYALWAIPLLRMVLPPMPAEWRGRMVPTLPVPEDIVISLGHPVAVLPAVPETGIGWPTAVIGIWAIGAIGFAGWHLIVYSRFCARIKAGGRRRAALVDGRVAMIESNAAAGPLAFGIWRKYVAFPADFAERYDEMERDLALAHELGHHARGDLAANWAALAMLAFHWFNPVAWRAFRAFRADQEMACDALVLAGRHPALRHAYGRAIVKSAHGGAVSAACHLHTINEIKGRLRMLTHHQKPTRRTTRVGLAGITALALTGLALTASGTRAAENLKAKVEDRIGVRIADIELPQLPEPPAPPAPAEAAEAPAAAAAPDAPDAPGAPPAHRVHVYKVKDGKRTIVVRRGDPVDPAEMARLSADTERLAADAERMAATIRVPEIKEMRCGGAGPTSYSVATAGGRSISRTVICTDRIERAASEGARAAAKAGQTRAFAMATARASIQSARAHIQAEPSRSDADRREALAGLDEAMAEVERQTGE
ncbi:M56 family metallopeptidase [Sphingomonas yantingensis]|uniref:Beta-lactamase regulating signal transducer with metallopeptidase domain n=1 Tax=Sphingomonas yantingensis TaxID=1241761 RepID=A0A7W9APZ1_9SPHN|nr:M56 family metallopeptidase [Sphingomonas yantingensis]MBB5698316.1 beta-lactamase regulating signal transducer with metallopeptidase domain [Sphingomonas yantingensis]